VRGGADDDHERYWYDGAGQRATKLGTTLTSGTTRSERVHYLPGLELRQTEQTRAGETIPTPVELLQVLTLGAAGRSSVRVLHWELGQPETIGNDQLRYSLDDQIGSSRLELDAQADLLTREEYYPYGGTAVWTARNQVEADAKYARYSGKERDATGLYYYGYRYYLPWLGRWASADPAGAIDGLNLYRMVRNSPISFHEPTGLQPTLGWTLLTAEARKSPHAVLSPLTPDLTGAMQTVDVSLAERRNIWPLSGLDSSEHGTIPIVSDLLNPAPGKGARLPEAVLQHGGIAKFSFFEINPPERIRYVAIAPSDETSTKQSSKAIAEAYWIPQGKSYDIPVDPIASGKPHHVFTPAFSGCSFVVDLINKETLRVYHVEGGKEIEQYNSPSIEHGFGMVANMQYADYGYYQDKEGQLYENVHGFAFLRYETNEMEGSEMQWRLHYQGQEAPAFVRNLRKSTSWFSSHEKFRADIPGAVVGRAIPHESKWIDSVAVRRSGKLA
uniref:RHS repeat-associated core domain-containing protein n=1 Tax=Burkholderia sp. GbtcB21 TaxID=2824766 RepID=UPI0027D2E1A2